MKKVILFSGFLSFAVFAILCCVSCGSGPSASEAVDLGLSVKWAPYNVGATSSEGCGGYYAWGETGTKDVYSTENSATYGKEVSDFSGNAEYDVALAEWGGAWRMPTKAEFEELVSCCTWEWSEQNGVEGFMVIGPNGNSIFLPALGRKSDNGDTISQDAGYYWTSTPYDNDPLTAHCYQFMKGYRGFFMTYRYSGYSIRPVCD